MIEQEGIKIETKLVETHPGVVMVETSGYVDQANCHLLQKTIDDSLAGDTYKLIFDFKNLVYMSSAGWGVLIGEIKRFRESGGDIKLANMGPEIYEIYQMLEFYHIISEYPSVEEALKSFGDSLETQRMEEALPLPPKPEPEPKPVTKAPAPVEEKPAPPKPKEEPKATPEPKQKSEPAQAAPREEPARNTPIAAEDKGIVYEKEIDVDIDNILLDEGIHTSASKTHNAPTAGGSYVSFEPTKYDRQSNIKVMPIPDKIRAIVATHPEFSPWKIRKALKEPEYGSVKVGYFKLRSLLKDLELDTKEKRFRYYRSA